jgi:hypothetical protein
LLSSPTEFLDKYISGLVVGPTSESCGVSTNKMTNNKRTRSKAGKPSGKQNIQAAVDKAVSSKMSRARQLMQPSRPQKYNTPLGELGNSIGNAVSWIFGRGSYTVKNNSLLKSSQNQVPYMHSSNESLVFRKREFLCNVNSTAAFTATRFSINPGLSESFPFLSAIASNFQEYRFRGLAYEFKTTSATSIGSTNTALGTIILACQYRANAPAFLDKLSMLNEMWAEDTVPCESKVMFVECSPAETPMRIQYVRSSALSSTEDQKFYDLGTFTIAAQGAQATSVAGELWVTYDVELYKPVIQSPSFNPLDSVYSYWTFGNSFSGAVPFGTSQVQVSNQLGITIVGNSALVFNQVGVYSILFYWLGGVAAALTMPLRTITNVASGVTATILGGTYTELGAPPDTTSTTTVMLRSVVKVYGSVAGDALAQFNLGVAGTLPATAILGYIEVTPLPYDTI